MCFSSAVGPRAGLEKTQCGPTFHPFFSSTQLGAGHVGCQNGPHRLQHSLQTHPPKPAQGVSFGEETTPLTEFGPRWTQNGPNGPQSGLKTHVQASQVVQGHFWGQITFDRFWTHLGPISGGIRTAKTPQKRGKTGVWQAKTGPSSAFRQYSLDAFVGIYSLQCTSVLGASALAFNGDLQATWQKLENKRL